MAEENQDKKKRRIALKVLKWIWRVFLLVVLALGIWFQAPWKVMALPVVFLLAATALPKAYRKWFWLATGITVLALIIWILLPGGNESWRAYTFDKELTAIEAKCRIPDEENAAIIYNRLLEDYDPNAMSPDFIDAEELDNITRNRPWSSQEHPKLAKWLQGQQETIELLIQAGRKNKCYFPAAVNQAALSQTMNRLSPLRGWAFLLLRAANNDLGDGRIDNALEKHITTLQMAKHQYQQPTLIEMLVGMAIEALALGKFEEFVVGDDAAEQHLSIIEEVIADIKHDWASDWSRILEWEKMFAKNLLCGFFYEVNTEGKTRLSRDPTAHIRSAFQGKSDKAPGYWQRKRYKVGIMLGWFFAPSTPEKVGEIMDAAYERYSLMIEPDFDWKKQADEVSPGFRLNFSCLIEHLVDTLGPSLYRIHDIYCRSSAEKKGVQIIIALRRYKNEYGKWPKSLEEVKPLAAEEIFVDPINGDTFIYKLTEENFTLYSKGKNNIDENGKYNSTWDPNTFEIKVEGDDWLIWPSNSY